MVALFNNYIYQPLFQILLFLYEKFSFGDLGIAIILLTIFIRIVLLPIFYKGAKDQIILQKIAPKLKEIQTKHKENKEKQVQETMALYKEHRVNPFSSFFLLLVQLPILFALFKMFSYGLSSIPNLEPLFLGIVDLTERNLVFVFLAAAAQYWQSKLMIPKTNRATKNLSPSERMARQMVVIGPLMTLFFLGVIKIDGAYLPSAVALYWLTTSVFSVIQQIVINKRLNINQEIKGFVSDSKKSE